MKKFSLFSLLLVATSFCFADELDTKITYRTSAEPLKQTIANVGKASGVTLTVPAFLGTEPIIVQVKDVPLRDFMAKIAETTGGEWQKNGVAYQLAFTSRHESAERARAQAKVLPLVIKSQAKFAKEVADMGGYTREQARIQADREGQNQAKIQDLQSGPVQRAPTFLDVTTPGLYCLKKLVATLDPRLLVQIPIGVRTVFSTVPTRMQKQMPASANNALSDYARLHALFVAESAALPKPKRGDNEFIITDQMVNRPIVGGISKILLVVFRNDSRSMTFQLLVADQQGNFASQSSLALNAQPDEKAQPTPPSNAPSEPITFSEAAKEHSALIQYAPNNSGGEIEIMNFGGKRSRTAVGIMIAVDGSAPAGVPMAKPMVSAEWRNRLLSPDKNEPLSFAVSDAMLGLADSNHCNLVALLPDSAAIQLASKVQQNMTPVQILDFVKTNCDCEVISSENWTIIRPIDSIQVRNTRPSRIASSNLLQSIAKEGRISLDAMAAYLQTQTSKYSGGGFLDRYCGLLSSDTRSRFLKGAGANFEMTKLWGSLDPTRRRQLLDGGKLELRLLAPNQAALISSLVFDSMGGPNIEPEAIQGGPSERRVQRFSTGEFSIGPSADTLALERTEYLGNGLPMTGTIELEMEDEDAVLATSPTSDESKLFTAREYGIYKSVAANENLGVTSSASFSSYERFKMGKRVSYTLTVDLTDRASLTGHLVDSLMPQGNTFVTYDQLPADFRKAVEEVGGQMKFGGPPPKH